MVLTEPDAGSDVGAGRTKAVKQDDGSWHIDGVKRFITSGDSGDLFENIFHLVLARPEGAGPGTKGLSLFYVPKYLFDPDTLDLGPHQMLGPLLGGAPQSLADAMHGAWVAFATSGDPNHAGLPDWPRYDPRTRPTMLLDEECRVEEDPGADEVALWDGVL